MQRYAPIYARLKAASDLSEQLQGLEDEQVMGALALATRERNERLAEVLATEALSRAHRQGDALEALQLYRLLVDSVVDYAIFALDSDGHIMTWNAGAERLKGYGPHEILGKPLATFYTAEDRARHHHKQLLAAAAEKGSVEEEGWRVRKDGSRFWARVTITALRAHDGRLRGFAKVTRDLTGVHEAQEALQRRERQHAVVAELGVEALRGAPLQQVFERAIHELRSVLEVDYAKVLQLDPSGDTLTLRAGVGWQPHVRVHQSQVSAGGGSQAGHTLVTEDPVVVDDLRTESRFSGPPLLVEHGVVSGMSVVVHGVGAPWGVLGIYTRTPRVFTQDDVNFLQSVANVLANAIQRKQAETTLEQRVEERTRLLTEMNRDLQTFANAASHDLRAPIRGVDVLLTAAVEDHGAQMPEQARELIAKALRDNKRAGRLIRDILAFARSSQDDLHPEDVDLTALVRETTQELDAQHPERRITWKVEEGMRVRADPRLLHIALWNLLDNAAKYSAANAHPRVEVETAREADRATTIRIRDNGVGFDPSESHRLFEPFQRLSTARGIEGTGLGLPTAARILARHGGRIDAEGQPGQGATFRLTFPTPHS